MKAVYQPVQLCKGCKMHLSCFTGCRSYYPLWEAEYFSGNIWTILVLLQNWALRLGVQSAPGFSHGLALQSPSGWHTLCWGALTEPSPAAQTFPGPVRAGWGCCWHWHTLGELVVKLGPRSSWAGIFRDLPAGSWATASKNRGCKSQCPPSQLQWEMQLRTNGIWRGFYARADVSGRSRCDSPGQILTLNVLVAVSGNRHLQFVLCACTHVGGPQFPSRISCMLNMAKDCQGFFHHQTRESEFLESIFECIR